MERTPAGPGESLQQTLLGCRRRLDARQRLIRGEAEVRAIPLDLCLQRDQCLVPIPVAQLLLQQLAAQVLHQLVPILSRIATSQPGLTERPAEVSYYLAIRQLH